MWRYAFNVRARLTQTSSTHSTTHSSSSSRRFDVFAFGYHLLFFDGFFRSFSLLFLLPFSTCEHLISLIRVRIFGVWMNLRQTQTLYNYNNNNNISSGVCSESTLLKKTHILRNIQKPLVVRLRRTFDAVSSDFWGSKIL